MFQVCEPQEKEQVVIEFEGCLDNGTCMDMEANVYDALAGTDAPIVFDLAKVNFVSSSFLRMCIYASRYAGDHGFQVKHAGPFIIRVFQIAGLGAMLSDD